MTLPELAIRRHVTTLMLLVSLAVLGSVAIARLPLAFMPDMEEPELFVRFPYPQSSPEQVEEMILRPAEDALGSLSGLKEMYATADTDGGMVRLEFDWAENLAIKRVEIWEKIDRIRRDLPDDLGDITVGTHWNNRESDDPIFEGRLSAKGGLSESFDLLDRRLIKPLQRVPGVAQVALDGVAPKEVRVNLRMADVELHRVDVREISAALRASNFDESLGRVTEEDRRFVLRTIGTFRSVDEIANLVVRADGLRLRDVADVTYKEPELDFGRHLDGEFAVGFTVSQESSANTVEVCDRLRARLEELRKDPELKGVEFLTWHNQGEEIKKTLSTLFYSGVFGAVLASIVLFLFLRRLSTTFVSVLCIPFSLVVTCGFLWLQGRTLNTLSLLGLIVGVGMLVDNAVVVIENIFRHQERGKSRKEAALLGSREVSVAVMAATLTSVIVFLPIVFNQPNEMNIRLREIGVTVCLTLLASLFVSQTLIPLATSWVIRAKARKKERWIAWLERRYVHLLKFNLRHRWITPVVGLAVTFSALYPYSQLEIDFDQKRLELYVQVQYRFSEETSLENKEKIVSEVEKLIDPHREELLCKSTYSWFSGRFTMTRVYLEEGKSTEENMAMVRARLREILPEIAGVRLEVSEPGRSWRRRDSGQRVAFQIFGEDAEILEDLAEEARSRLEGVPGLVGAYADTRRGQEELHVALDPSLVSRHEVFSSQIAERVGLTFRGRRLPRFRTADGEREMWLALEETETDSVAQLRNLPLWMPDGRNLPLASLATFEERRGPTRVEREDRMKRVWVGASYTDGRKEEHIERVREVMEPMVFPPGYTWQFGDWQKRRREQSLGFLVDLGLALLLVFAVMAGLFESVSRAIALMVALPFAVAGALWTLHLFGTDFDQPAAVGLLLLIGIVVNNGIVLIEHINAYQRQGMSRMRAMLQGGRERLRPILMTAVTTLIGLVPMVVERPSLGGVYYFSMALVIMGGIALSTFLTAVLLPTTATLVEDFVAGSARLLSRGRRR